MPVPSSLALTTIQTNAQILSADHRNNYAAVQTAVNALITALSGGTVGQYLRATDTDTIGWAGGYTAYTPTWTSNGTQPALLNGTLTGRYLQIGKMVQGSVTLTMGSTTTFGTGAYILSLPVTPNLGNPNFPLGSLVLVDASAGSVYAYSAVVGGGGIVGMSGANPGVLVAATSPFTFAVSDTIFVNFTYEAA